MQCPHCLHRIPESWNKDSLRLYTINGHILAQDETGMWGTLTAKCPSCERVIIALGVCSPSDHPIRWNPDSQWLVYPKTIARSPIPPEVPDKYAADYREACLVLPDSEKASAALSRRCLQYILHEKLGIRERNLADEIQRLLDSKQLPPYLADELDAIRHIGNFAAHPTKNTNTGEIVEVEPEEAEWLLNLLDGLFDFYFVQPAKSKARQDALNAKLRDAGKSPMKSG